MSIKNQKRLAFILSIVLVLVILVAVYLKFSRAWFASDTDPVIYSEQLNIVSSEGLNIQLENQGSHTSDSTIHEEINLKDVAKDIDTYKMLDQVSSRDGVNFFKRTEANGLITYTKLAEVEGYIEVTFLLINSEDTFTSDYTGPTTRNVYLDDLYFNIIKSDGTIDTEKNNFAQDALRVSLEITNYVNVTDGQPIVQPAQIYIIGIDSSINAFNRYDNFGPTQDEDDNDIPTTLIQPNGVRNYYENPLAVENFGLSNEIGYDAIQTAVNAGLADENQFTSCLGTQRVYYSSAFMKGDGERIVLTSIAKGDRAKVTYRMWLEGSDPRSSIPITGTRISMYMKFANELVA